MQIRYTVKGALLQFDIDVAKLQNAWNKGQEITVSFAVITEDGNSYDVPGQIRIPPVFGFLHDIHIVGTVEDGFLTEQ